MAINKLHYNSSTTEVTRWQEENKADEIQTFWTINSGDKLTEPQVTVSDIFIQLARSHQLIYLANSKFTT